MMYNMLVSNKKSIQSQYDSPVYADSTNVTPAIIESSSNFRISSLKNGITTLSYFPGSFQDWSVNFYFIDDGWGTGQNRFIFLRFETDCARFDSLEPPFYLMHFDTLLKTITDTKGKFRAFTVVALLLYFFLF